LSEDDLSTSEDEDSVGDDALSLSGDVLPSENELPLGHDISLDSVYRSGSRSGQDGDYIVLHSSDGDRIFRIDRQQGREEPPPEDRTEDSLSISEELAPPVNDRGSVNRFNPEGGISRHFRKEPATKDKKKWVEPVKSYQRHHSMPNLPRSSGKREQTPNLPTSYYFTRGEAQKNRLSKAKNHSKSADNPKRKKHIQDESPNTYRPRPGGAMMAGRFDDRLGDEPSPYQKPISRRREPLSFDVSLDGTQGVRFTTEPWDWDKSPVKKGRRNSSHRLHILKATRTVDEEGNHRIDLKYHPNASRSDASLPISIKWLYVQPRNYD
jgi:hypothetical protein